MISSTLPVYTPMIPIHHARDSFTRCNNVVPQNTSTCYTTPDRDDDDSVMGSLKPLNLTTDMTRAHLSSLETFLKKSYSPKSCEDPSRSRRNGFFESGLNLGKLWLQPGAEEDEEFDEVSEVDLHRRLLSESPEDSPRNYIGDRWRELHGCNEWTGLLDPLDEDLRREVVRYGEFIQAAYQSFFLSSSFLSSAEENQDNEKCHIPAFFDDSYKVTKTLYTTSSIGFPGWVENVVPELVSVTQRSNRIGFVAVCEDDQEVERMGRRDIVIALRGTCTCLEWAENLRDSLVLAPGPRNDDGSGQAGHQPKVQCGFSNLFKTPGVNRPSLSESVVQEVRRVLELYKGESLSITVTGHSLGAALAILVADELSNAVEHLPLTAVFSFGGPRVGNRAFTNRINVKNLKILRVVNCQDVITRVPGMFFMSEELDQKLREMIPQGALKFLDDNTTWAYSHVGTELRIDSKMSPYLKPDADAVCCHDMEAYLHLVDGFIGSNCPFRENAKRSLVKLVDEQKSNMKKLCLINRAKSFRVEEELEIVRPVSSYQQVHQQDPVELN